MEGAEETTGDEARDATRRTRLASERTQLAWWRTGLTALAVALGVGRIVPEIDPEATEWPCVALGVAFAIYGVVLIAYGSMRARDVNEAVTKGGYSAIDAWASAGLTVAGALLGLLTAVLIAVN